MKPQANQSSGSRGSEKVVKGGGKKYRRKLPRGRRRWKGIWCRERITQVLQGQFPAWVPTPGDVDSTGLWWSLWICILASAAGYPQVRECQRNSVGEVTFYSSCQASVPAKLQIFTLNVVSPLSQTFMLFIWCSSCLELLFLFLTPVKASWSLQT